MLMLLHVGLADFTSVGGAGPMDMRGRGGLVTAPHVQGCG